MGEGEVVTVAFFAKMRPLKESCNEPYKVILVLWDMVLLGTSGVVQNGHHFGVD